MIKKLLSFDPKKRKKILVGIIKENALLKDVQKWHLMRIIDGYGIQETAFCLLLEREIKFIVLNEIWIGGKKWYSKVSDWQKSGKVMDFGNGKQRFLSRKFMTETNLLK